MRLHPPGSEAPYDVTRLAKFMVAEKKETNKSTKKPKNRN